jgi:hypothetical protein
MRLTGLANLGQFDFFAEKIGEFKACPTLPKTEMGVHYEEVL